MSERHGMQLERPNIANRGSWQRYLQGVVLPDGAQLGIREVSYQEYELANPTGTVVERSMLLLPELALLFMLARDHYAGKGEIIDLGPLLGVGTNALCRGLAQNVRVTHKEKRIHSFDLFRAKGMGNVITEVSRSGAVLDRFLRNNQDYLYEISVAPGDILDLRWDRSPVEILFVDIAKNWDLNGHVIRHFFPCLIPGESVLVQQDYVHFAEYWIPITMEIFSEYFEHLYYVRGSSSVYRYTKRIPNELLYQNLQELPLARKIRCLEQAQSKAPPSVREVLKCSQAYCLIEHGGYNEAAEVLKTVAESAPVVEPSEDFHLSIEPNRRAVNAFLKQKTGKSGLVDQQPMDDLKAELHVVVERTELASTEKIRGSVRVRNISETSWSFLPASVGVVNLGAHLLKAETSEVVDYDFLRYRIGPNHLLSLAPGGETAFDFEFPSPVYGKYILEFDLVAEMICWFGQNGSKTVTIPLTVT